jgi:hypothetical protein
MVVSRYDSLRWKRQEMMIVCFCAHSIQTKNTSRMALDDNGSLRRLRSSNNARNAFWHAGDNKCVFSTILNFEMVGWTDRSIMSE